MTSAMSDDIASKGDVVIQKPTSTRIPLSARLFAIRELYASLSLLQKAEQSSDYKLVVRALSSLHFISEHVTLSMLHDAASSYCPSVLPLIKQIIARVPSNHLDHQEKEEKSHFARLRTDEMSRQDAEAKAVIAAEEREIARRNEELKHLLASASATAGISARSLKRRGIILTESTKRDSLLRAQKEEQLKADEEKKKATSAQSANVVARKKAEEENARAFKAAEARIADVTFDYMEPTSFLRSVPQQTTATSSSDAAVEEKSSVAVGMTDVDTDATDATAETSPTSATTPNTILIGYFLRYLACRAVFSRKEVGYSVELLESLLHDVEKSNLRTLDPLMPSIYLLYCLVEEKNSAKHNLARIHGHLLRAHSHAVRVRNDSGIVALGACILRSFILQKQYPQADIFVTATDKPSESVDGALRARYSFYSSLIAAVSLRYSESLELIDLALRNCSVDTVITPSSVTVTGTGTGTTTTTSAGAGKKDTDKDATDDKDKDQDKKKGTTIDVHALEGYKPYAGITSPRGVGFFQLAVKLKILCQLLNGECPERSLLNSPTLQTKEMEKYAVLINAVRIGDVPRYRELLQDNDFMTKARTDGLESLVTRLELAVMKAALTEITKAYKRISVESLVSKLGLQNSLEVELVCSKAIADGLISAKLHQDGYLESSFQEGAFASPDTRGKLLDRIDNLVTLQVSSARSLQYPEQEAGFEDEDQAKERLKQEKKLQDEYQKSKQKEKDSKNRKDSDSADKK